MCLKTELLTKLLHLLKVASPCVYFNVDKINVDNNINTKMVLVASLHLTVLYMLERRNDEKGSDL